jgi:cbb3-type cytochrome oxidase maturation protein
MSVIFLLLPVAILLVALFVSLFLWAARDGQFDDVTTPQVRILLDEDSREPRPARVLPNRPQERP